MSKKRRQKQRKTVSAPAEPEKVVVAKPEVEAVPREPTTTTPQAMVKEPFDLKKLVTPTLIFVFLVALAGFMYYVRTMSSASVFTDWPWIGNTTYVNVAADDGVYHMRLVYNFIHNFPTFLMYDAYTHYPWGSMIHFGPLYTVLLAAPALILGGGNPDVGTVAVMAAYVPPVLGAISIFPVYLIAKRLFGRVAGITAAVTLAFMPGSFMWRTVIGSTDHHPAEILFMVCTVACLIYALKARKKTSWNEDDLLKKDKDTMRWLAYSALTGVCLVCYILIWPGAMFLAFIITVYFAIQILIDYMEESSLDYTALTAVIALGIPFLAMIPYAINIPTFQPMQYTSFQAVLLGLALAVPLLMYGVAYVVRKGSGSKLMYPVILGVFVLAGGIVLYFISPDTLNRIYLLFQTLVPNYGMLTVMEAAPTDVDNVFPYFQFAIVTYALGMVLLFGRVVKRMLGEDILFLIWNLFILYALYNQNRFAYYFGMNVALMTGYAGYVLLSYVKAEKLLGSMLTSISKPSEVAPFVSRNMGRVVSTVLICVSLVVVAVYPVVPMSGNGTDGILLLEAKSSSVGMPYTWYESLMWMKNHTPSPEAPGFYYNGTYARPTNGTFDLPTGYHYNGYPSNAYSVMSWWDYGHMIEYVAERIPEANPFQAGINEMWSANYTGSGNYPMGNAGASPFFVSGNETKAYEILNNTNSRYVVIDNQMACGKFEAIKTWVYDTAGWTTQVSVTISADETFGTYADSSKFYSSMMSRLYYVDCDQMSHFRLVHDSAGDYIVTYKYANIDSGTISSYAYNSFGNYTEAYNSYSQSRSPTWVSAQHTFVYDSRPPVKDVKIYERVKGATIVGKSYNATNVTAYLSLVSDSGRPFNYTMTVPANNGTFRMTVPYPTTLMEGAGYSYDVRATSWYNIQLGNGTRTVCQVTESQVMNGEEVYV